jgi:hypothetical protein
MTTKNKVHPMPFGVSNSGFQVSRLLADYDVNGTRDQRLPRKHVIMNASIFIPVSCCAIALDRSVFIPSIAA